MRLHKTWLILGVFIGSIYITNKYSYTNAPQRLMRIQLSNVPIIDTLKPMNDGQSISAQNRTLVMINKPRIRGGLKEFMSRLGISEGLGKYETVSERGYLGMYQFHPNTLKSIGFEISSDEFLMNPVIQDSAMVTYLKRNANQLRRIITQFNNKIYNGVYITKAGILAGAHLVGPGGVMSFFYPERYNYRTVDGNGVHVSRYMEKFAGYDLRGL